MTMTRRACATVLASAALCCAAATLGVAPAFALDGGDRTLIPGTRVGAIVAATPPADLAKIFGAANIVATKLGFDGDEFPGAVIHRETADELQVAFSEDGKRILFVRVNGTRWATPSGIRVGATLADLERINGGPFTFNGFGWGLGGIVRSGRKLIGPNFSIGVGPKKPGPEGAERQVDGDRAVSSRNAMARRMDIRVEWLHVDFQR